MAYVTVVINLPNEAITQINAEAIQEGAHKELNALIDVLAGIAGGTKPASYYVTSTSADPGVVVDGGANSIQKSYNRL